jgi:hypothetical protein
MSELIFETIDVVDIYTNKVTGKSIKCTKPDGSIWFVPEDVLNLDYQEYLSWLSEGDES